MEGNFTEESRSLLISAKEEMYKLKHSYVGTEHLLLAILKSNLKNRLNKYNITYEIALKNIKKIVGVGTKETDLFLYTPVLKRIIENSIIDSKDNNTDVTPEILFLNFLEEGEGVGIRILLISNIDLDKLYLEFKDNYKNKKNKNNEIINELGCNLNELNIDPVIGREKEINRIIEILSRRSKNNPILIGEAGVGKTAIVEELSKRIKEGKVPSKLLGKKIIKVDMASIVAGTKYRGEFEEKIKKLINAVSDDHNIILFIDEIHTIVGAGGAEGAIDASNILKPALARNEISLIGATTISEYKKFICEDKALERRFQKVIIDEPNTVETINIITNLVPIYEKFHNVKINKKDIENIVKLSNKYIKDRHEPDASIDILDEVCSRVSLKESKKDLEYKKIINEYNKINLQKKELIKKEKYEEALKIKEIEKYYLDKINTLELYRKKDVNKVTINDIANVIKDKCNLPIYEILGFNKKTINNIIRDINNVFYGQYKVKEKIAYLIKKVKLGYTNNKCISYMFLGPTGCGKTYLAEILSKKLVNDNVITLDMVDYKDPSSINKLIGTTPGYVGYKDNNNIFEIIKTKPNSILILDKIDEACNDVIKLFSQILDSSKIRDSKGEYIYFNNVIIIMTSSLNCNNLGFKPNENYNLKEYFSESFINKIDEIIVFDNLDKKTVEKIIKNRINELVNKYDIQIHYDNTIIDEIINMSEYKLYGASKINHIINNKINNLIINELINNNKKIHLTTINM
ncbi:MAG: ATP-dependent Clp protease ATP-binding subunit [Bacilli bacterium]|nr:ATP-dependent Clp protease ATP-binding subunit [Bacilli bacterium]